MRHSTRLSMASALFAVVVASTAGAADKADKADKGEKAACVAAYESAQQLRAQGKLRSSREQLAICARDACPKLVRTDCAHWMGEVTAAIPTVVFGARDSEGHDLTDARVTWDGAAVTEQQGQEVSVDPGAHKVRFEAAGFDPHEEQVAIRAGEKGRRLVATLAQPKAEQVEAAQPREAPHAEQPKKLPILVPVLGGLGIAALGTGAYLAISAGSEASTLKSTCAPHCPSSAVSAVNLRYEIAAITGGVGALSLGIAAWLFFRRGSSSETPTQTAVDWIFAPSHDGVSAGVRLKM